MKKPGTNRKMSKGGPYIGPNGGQWADPQHTVHWDPKVHGAHPAKVQSLTFHDKNGRGVAYQNGHLFTDLATGKSYATVAAKYEKVSPRASEDMEDMGFYGVRGIHTVKAREATPEESAKLAEWQRARDAFDKAKKDGISKLGWTTIGGGELAHDSWQPPAGAEKLDVPPRAPAIPGSTAYIPRDTVFIDRDAGVIYKRDPGSYDDYRQSVSQIPLTLANEAGLLAGLAAMRGDGPPPRPKGEALALAEPAEPAETKPPMKPAPPAPARVATSSAAKNLQWRKTREGDWAIFGPAKHIKPGEDHIVHKRDGSSSVVHVKKVSGQFNVDGVPHVYGLLKGGTAMPFGQVLVRKDAKYMLADALTVMFKSRSAPKFIRKVPTKRMTKTGKMRYRYIYADTATARHSKKDDKINLQNKGVHHVVSADKDGVVLRHERTGEERRVTHEELHAEMAAIYKKRFDRGAELLIKKFVRSAPEIKANPDDPEATHAELKDRFDDAGVDETTAKHLIGFLAARQGWKNDAKKSLLSLASDRAMGRVVAPRARSIARGAENLSKQAGQKEVRSRDVAKAAALRVPEGGFDNRLAELRAKAQVELATVNTLLGVIEATGGNEASRRSMIDFASTVLAHDAAHELEQLATAFPGMGDMPELAELQQARAKWKSLLAERREVKTSTGAYGVEATMYVPDSEGSPVPQKARYRLMEADDVIASHDARKGFIQRPDYPEGIQTRPYHSNAGEQQKVREHAQKLLPPFIVNTNSDAVNGPPIITDDGIVLGGNSRAMSLQVAYDDGDSAVSQSYRNYLTEHAHEFGFAKGDVSQFKHPVLVREVEVADKSADNLGLLVQRYNENFTQGLDPRVDQVARGRLVSKGLLNAIADGMSQMDDAGEPVHATLNAFLTSPDGKTLVKQMQLRSNGRSIIDKRNRSQYINKDGSFNEDGKTFVERVLVGHVIPDPDLLSELLPSQVSAIAASVPHVVAAASHGHDLQKHLKPVLQSLAFMRKTQPAPYNDLRQLDAESGGFADFSGDASFGQGKPKVDADGRKLLEILNERMSKPRTVAAFFRAFASAAQKFRDDPQAAMTLAGAEKKVGPGWTQGEADLAKKGVSIGGLIDLAKSQSQSGQRGLDLFGKGKSMEKGMLSALGGSGGSKLKPPSGFMAIPDSKHGGFHKQVGGKWVTWYPDSKSFLEKHQDAAWKDAYSNAASSTKKIHALVELERLHKDHAHYDDMVHRLADDVGEERSGVNSRFLEYMLKRDEAKKAITHFEHNLPHLAPLSGAYFHHARASHDGAQQKATDAESKAARSNSGSYSFAKGLTWVPMSRGFGEWLWSHVMAKGTSTIESPDGTQYLQLPATMLKSKGQPKPGATYTKRVPTNNPKRPWRYFYAAHHGGGVHNKKDFNEGARFAHGDGHLTIHGMTDGKLIVSQSVDPKDTPSHHGDDVKSARVLMTHDELSAALEKHHKAKLDEHKAKLDKEHAEAIESGNAKGAKRIRDEAKRFGHSIPEPTPPAPPAPPEEEYDWSGGGKGIEPPPPVEKKRSPVPTKRVEHSTDAKSTDVSAVSWQPEPGENEAGLGTMRIRYKRGKEYERAGIPYDTYTKVHQGYINGSVGQTYNALVRGIDPNGTKVAEKRRKAASLVESDSTWAPGKEPKERIKYRTPYPDADIGIPNVLTNPNPEPSTRLADSPKTPVGSTPAEKLAQNRRVPENIAARANGAAPVVKTPEPVAATKPAAVKPPVATVKPAAKPPVAAVKPVAPPAPTKAPKTLDEHFAHMAEVYGYDHGLETADLDAIKASVAADLQKDIDAGQHEHAEQRLRSAVQRRLYSQRDRNMSPSTADKWMKRREAKHASRKLSKAFSSLGLWGFA